MILIQILFQKLYPNYSEYKLNLVSNNKINEIMVYSSSQSGLGKSTRIYNEFEGEIHLFFKYCMDFIWTYMIQNKLN